MPGVDNSVRVSAGTYKDIAVDSYSAPGDNCAGKGAFGADFEAAVRYFAIVAVYRSTGFEGYHLFAEDSGVEWTLQLQAAANLFYLLSVFADRSDIIAVLSFSCNRIA